jgi:putative Mg2+ transporter-C (MgtC) family protein
MLRLIIATFCGWALGRERKKNEKHCGSRTLALVCLTACFLALFSTQIEPIYMFDFVRLISYFLPAVGFLGISIISKTKNGIEGLTTSATLLAVLPIGFSIGVGLYFYGIFSTILVYCILESKYWFNEGDK